MNFGSAVDGKILESNGASFSTTQNVASALPLDEEQMQTLVSIIYAAVSDFEHNNATFSLIKTLSSKQYISPEYYDLMDMILKLSVQCQKVTVRQQCCQIFIQYLISYPMGEKRLVDHLKQMVLNIKYEYEDGRISSLDLLSTGINKLPTPLLEQNAQLFFLPLVLQLVNDDSKKCRMVVAQCVSLLLKRLSIGTLQSFYDYITRWSKSNGHESLSLKRTSAQLFGIFIDSRADFMKRGSTVTDLTSNLQETLEHEENEWEQNYFCLLCVEKLYAQFPVPTAKCHGLWIAVVKCLAKSHPWVKQVSSRIIHSHVSELDPATFASAKAKDITFLTNEPGILYEIVRNLCYQLNVDEEHQVDTISLLAIKTLAWAIQAMSRYPELCFKDDLDDSESTSRDPTRWVFVRLSNIAKERGKRRREAVFKCFAAFASSCSTSSIIPHLDLMIEPLDRTITEASNKRIAIMNNSRNPESEEAEEFPKEVLQLLEDKCGTEEFLKSLAIVKTRAREKRDKRKQEIAAEAVQNPQAAAKRRLIKQEREKNRKKRRIEEKMMDRGAYKKKGRLITEQE